MFSPFFNFLNIMSYFLYYIEIYVISVQINFSFCNSNFKIKGSCSEKFFFVFFKLFRNFNRLFMEMFKILKNLFLIFNIMLILLLNTI